MGHAREKHQPEEEAKVLPAREALSLIWGGREDEEGEASSGGEEAVRDPDRRADGARDRSSPEA
jgi:hypothetical protein